MNYSGFDVYEKSIHKALVDGLETEVFMAKDTGGDFLVTSAEIPGFSGERRQNRAETL